MRVPTPASRPTLLVALTALALPLYAAPAWAQGPPPVDEVAIQVGDQPILKSELDRFLQRTTRYRGHRLLPPDFKRCVAAERRSRSKGSGGTGGKTPRERCGQRYRSARKDAIRYLIQAAWTRSGAAAKGVDISPQRLHRVFEREKHDAFPTERGYRRFLRQTGQTEADVISRVEIDLLQTRLIAHVTHEARPVRDADVTRYYSRHHKRWKGIPPAKAKHKIRRLLRSKRTTIAIGNYIETFTKHYRAITACEPAYKVPDCGAPTLSALQLQVAYRSRQMQHPR